MSISYDSSSKLLLLGGGSTHYLTSIYLCSEGGLAGFPDIDVGTLSVTDYSTDTDSSYSSTTASIESSSSTTMSSTTLSASTHTVTYSSTYGYTSTVAYRTDTYTSSSISLSQASTLDVELVCSTDGATDITHSLAMKDGSTLVDWASINDNGEFAFTASPSTMAGTYEFSVTTTVTGDDSTYTKYVTVNIQGANSVSL